MKKRFILTSILTIAMCVSLIAGATYALFTSESKVNVAVTSGKVEVVSSLGDVVTSSMGTEQAEGMFANGGTAEVRDETLALNNITPGDKAVVAISVTNESTVTAKYRVRLVGSGDADLVDQLLVGYSTDGTNYTYYSEFVTDWTALGEGTTVSYLSVELPAYVGNAALDKTCTLAITVEAVQGNGATEEAGTAKKVYPVTTEEELERALTDFADGDTILFYGETWTEATVAYTDAKTLNVRGITLSKLTINAPNGTVNVYNDMNELEVQAVAGESLHIYGNILSLNVQQGHAVVEAGAAVQNVSVAPVANTTATVDVKETAVVESVKVDTSAENATAGIVIGENVIVKDFDMTGDGDVTIENEGEIDISGMRIDTVAKLKGALQIGGTIDLASDIVIYVDPSLSTQNVLLPLMTTTKDIVLNLNGYTLSYAYDAEEQYLFTPVMISVNSGTLTINGDGCITAEMGDNNAYAIDVFGGNVVVNGGEYYGALTAFQVEKGSLLITDGFFDLAQSAKAQVPHYAKYVVNCIDKAYRDGTAKIRVEGGTFVNFDPSADPEGAGTSYLTGYYKAVPVDQETETWYVVVEKLDGLPAWDKTVDISWYNETDTEFTLMDAADLAGLAQLVNNGNTTFKGKIIKLGADINLNNVNWTPIGGTDTGKKFEGTFDGQGHIIYNLKITKELLNTSSNCYVGLFGACTSAAKLQNFTIYNADVKGSLNVAVVLGGSGGAEAKIDQVHVAGNIKVYGYWYVGAILGKGYSTVTNCSVVGDSVETSYVEITGGYVGGIVGYMGEGNCQIRDCSVTNITISGLYNGIGGISGILHYGNTISGCTLENVTVWQTAGTFADIENNEVQCGAFAGTYLNNNGASVPTLSDNTFSGALYYGADKYDILTEDRYVGDLWYGAPPRTDINIDNCTIVMPAAAN